MNLSNLFQYFKRSRKWPEVRQEHIKKQPFCQCCGRKDKLEVHHIEPVHKNPERELDPNNLITLCGQHCHLVFGHLMDYTSWNENIIEDARMYLEKIKQRPYKNENNNQNTTTGVIGKLSNFFSRNKRS